MPVPAPSVAPGARPANDWQGQPDQVIIQPAGRSPATWALGSLFEHLATSSTCRAACRTRSASRHGHIMTSASPFTGGGGTFAPARTALVIPLSGGAVTGTA